MGAIDFLPKFDDYIDFSIAAAKDGKYVSCIHNLFDALKSAQSDEEKAEAYRFFADLFLEMGNTAVAKNAMFRSCLVTDKGGYYTIDYDKFFPYDGVVEEEDFPAPDSRTILAYNDVYNHFVMGNYEKGFDLLCTLPPDYKSLDEVIGVLYNAVEDGKKVDFGAFEYKILMLAGVFSMKSADFVRVLLQGSAATRAVMVDGVNFFAEEIEDRRILCDVGEAFLKEGEYECAEICFKKALEENEIEEIALYYMAVLSAKKGKEEEKTKYWNKYKLCYAPFGAPCELIENKFGKKTLPIFCNEDFSTEARTLAQEIVSGEEKWDMPYAKKIEYALSFANETVLLKLLRKLDLKEETNVNAIKNVFTSAYVSDGRKRRLLAELFREGYVGRVAVTFEKKGEIFDCANLSVRGGKAVWQNVYERVSMGIVCSKSFLPYQPSLLAHQIKNLAKLCADNGVKVEKNDAPFLSNVVAADYNRKTRMKTNIEWQDDVLPPISMEEMQRGLEKFSPEVFRF